MTCYVRCVNSLGSNDLTAWAIRRLRRYVCTMISAGGLIFAIIVIETQPTAVAALVSAPAVAGSVLAIASLVAVKKYHEIERAWLAIGLFAFAIVLVVAINVFFR